MYDIFISYRRTDSHAHAGRIYDFLVKEFGEKKVFFDVEHDNIPIGADFPKIVKEGVNQCRVLLVIIGPQWVDIRNSANLRRLDDPDDLVRIEVEIGIERLSQKNFTIIPVLVNNAKMPPKPELPASIAKLADINAIEVRPSLGFNNDTKILIDQIRKTIPKRSFIRQLVMTILIIAIGILARCDLIIKSIIPTPTPTMTSPPTITPPSTLTMTPTSIPSITPPSTLTMTPTPTITVGVNLLENGDFEEGTSSVISPWEFLPRDSIFDCDWTTDYKGAYEGTKMLSTSHNSSENCYALYQDISIYPQICDIYRLTFVGKEGWPVEGIHPEGRLIIEASGSGRRQVRQTSFMLDGTWRSVEVELTIQYNTHSKLSAEIYLDSVGFPDYQIDDVRLIKVSSGCN